MARLRVDITADNSQFRQAMREVQDNVSRTTKDIEKNGDSMSEVFKKVAEAAGIAFGLKQLKEFATQLAQTRGEFQQLEVAFTTMLGSANKAGELMEQLTKTAATTPFDLKGVAAGARQLLAYGTAADEVNDILVHLGDIAAGMGLRLDDLVYLYGTTMVQGRMYGQDLRQFLNRGIPLVEQLAKQFGVTKDEVSQLVSEGKVGAQDFKQAIMEMSSEGSKFGGLMDAQSKTITGQISNIEDNIDMMMNDIGKQSEGVINNVLGMTGTAIENWRSIAKAIAIVVTAYGTYKGVVVACWAIQKAMNIAGSVQAFLSLATSIRSARDAMLLFNMASKANVIGLLASVLATAAAAFAVFRKDLSETAKMSEKYGESAGKTIVKVNKLAQIIGVTSEESKAHKDALSELNQVLEDYGQDVVKEGDSIEVVNEKRTRLIALIKEEAIERTKANRIDTAVEGYAQEIEKLEEDFKKRITSLAKRAGADADIVTAAVSDVVVANIGKLSAANNTEEYEKAFHEINERILEVAKRAGMDEGQMRNSQKYNDAIGDFVLRLNEANKAQEEAINAAMRFAKAEKEANDSAVPFADTVDDLSKKLQNTSNDAHGLYRNIKAIIDEYGGKNNIDFKINVDAEVPSWMKSMSSGELKRLASFFTALGAKATNGVNVNGKFMSREDLLQRGATYGKAYDERVTQEEEEAADAAKRKEEAKKTEKARKNAAEKTAKERKDAETKLSDEMLKLRQQNLKDEIDLMKDGSEKRIAQTRSDYAKQLSEIEKQAKEFAELNKKAGISGTESVDVNGSQYGSLTSEQAEALEKSLTNAAEAQKRAINEISKEEAQAMRDYLKEYGSLQQQKLALAEEYAQKIENAETEGARLRLEKERDAAMSQLSFENISMGIDWSSLLKGVNNLSTELLNPMLEQLEAYTKTEDFNKAEMAEREKVVELIHELRQYVGSDGTSWETLAEIMRQFTESVARYRSDAEKEDQAYANLETARTKRENGEITQEEYDKLAVEARQLSERTVESRDAMQKLGDEVNNATEEVKNYVSPLTTALNKAGGWNGVNGYNNVQNAVGNVDNLKGTLDSVLPTITDPVAQSIGSALSSGIGGMTTALSDGIGSVLSSGIGSIVGVIAQIPKLVLDLTDAIKDFVTGVLDSVTEIISLEWIGDLVDSILDAVGNLIDEILDLPENLAHVLEAIVVDGVGDLLVSVLGRVGNILSFGALDSDMLSWFGWGDSDEDLAEDTERLTNVNEALTKAVEALTDVMEETAVADASDVYQQQKSYLEESMTNTQELMARSASAYTNGVLGIGGHSSSNSKINKAMTSSEWARISEIVGYTVDSASDFFNLSSEEMYKVSVDAADLYAKIKQYADDGYQDAAQYMDDYIGYWQQLEELEDTYQQKLTSTDFDSVRDSFKSLVSDMTATYSDMTEQFEDLMREAVIESLMTSKYDDALQDWYDTFAEYMENGFLSSSEQAKLKENWDELTQSAQDDIQALYDMLGWQSGTTQEATQKSYTAMSEDTGEELSGRLTAVYESQIRLESIVSTNMASTLQVLSSLATLNDTNASTLREMRNLMINGNSYMEDTLKYVKLMYSGWSENLEKITSYTSRL